MSRAPALLLALALAAGCDPVAADAVEEVVATRSADAVSAKTNLVLFAEKFAGEAALAEMDVDAARARAVELLADRLRALAIVDCDPQLATDPIAGTVDTAVAGCRIGQLQLDGTMHAQVEIETAPCDTGDCPSAVVWTLDEFDLQIGAGSFRPHLSGRVVLRDPVDVALPMTWSTGDDFVLENRLGTFSTRSTAAWTVAADKCVVGMQLEARLDRIEADDDEPDADLDLEVGTIVVSAEGLDRCPAKCPTAGDVRLSFGRGRVLEWGYDGQALDVVAPGGHHFTTRLICNE